MTTRCVVLPRGINVGSHNRVSMAELRPKLAEAGYGDPVTILQSGNIIVTAEIAADQPDAAVQHGQPNTAAVAAAVQQLLADEFDVHVPCAARTAAEIEAILERNPLGHVADDGARYLVNFLSEAPTPAAAQALVDADHSPEVLHIEGTEAYARGRRSHRLRRVGRSPPHRGHRGLRLGARGHQGAAPVVLASRAAPRRDRHGPQLEHTRTHRSKALASQPHEASADHPGRPDCRS